MLWRVFGEIILLAEEWELPRYQEETVLQKLRNRRDTECFVLWGVLGKSVLLAEERQLL